MNPFLKVLSEPELHDLLVKESRKFMTALHHNVPSHELQKIRNNIIEIEAILRSREEHGRGKKGPDKNDSGRNANSP